MVQMAFLLLFSSTIAVASFGPAVRIDHQYLPNHRLCHTAMAIGPGAPSRQPIYVAFEDDSTMFAEQADIMLQKSTDAGRTWLPADLLIRRGAPRAQNPDVATDSDGNVHIVYKDEYNDATGAYHHQILYARSSDGGATWSAPVRVDGESTGGIGRIRIVADTAGNLFAAWNQLPGGLSRIFTSVSTDKGATWSARVCVDDDTLTDESCHPDVFVQPGTNHYLVATTSYRWIEGHIRPCAFLYRSTNRGQTFEPGVQLDTFNWAAGTPHVVADRDHIICDYDGESRVHRGTTIAEARTFYTHADSWGSPVPVTNLDSLQELYLSGSLALSGDGRVHTTLMVDDTALGYDIYYASSSDHGVSWSDIEPVYVDSIRDNWYPDIVADAAGHAYVVWQHGGGDGEIWFSTNNPAAIAEQQSQPAISAQPLATIVRNVLFCHPASSVERDASCVLLDISGRKVLDLVPGANDVRALAPGIYFVRSEPSAVSRQPLAVTKVVVSR